MAASTSRIDLAWTDTSSNESGFKVERSADGASGWTQIGTTAANGTSYSDTGLSASTTYYYRVRAYSAWGNSSYTSTVNATTNAPASVFTDTFNRADSRAGLGTSSDGTRTWTLTPANADFSGDGLTDGWEIKNNAAGINYLEGAMYATLTLGSPLGRFKATMRTLPSGASAGDPFFIVADFTDASSHLRLAVDHSNSQMSVYRMVAGSAEPAICGPVSIAVANGDSFELELLAGAQVKMYRNGVQIGTTGTDLAAPSVAKWGVGHGGGVEGEPWVGVIEAVEWS